jgi:hypothetical protein
MMVALSRVRVALCCGGLVVFDLSPDRAAESLANVQFILAPTMDLTHHLA